MGSLSENRNRMSQLKIVCEPERYLQFAGTFCENTVLQLKIKNEDILPVLFKVKKIVKNVLHKYINIYFFRLKLQVLTDM